ncbi:MAG: helix-hairpin-helix domain-containing protein [Cyclobacteriaceae bacterium]
MGNKFIHFLKLYFGFTQREARGFVLVIPLLFFLYLIPTSLDRFYQNQTDREYENYLEYARIYFDGQDAAFTEDVIHPQQIQIEVAENFQDEQQDNQDDKNAESSNRNNRQVPRLNEVPFHETDAVVLQMVSGIGPVLSSRIVAFRDNLGGFYTKEQILEVYGIDPDLADKIYEAFPFEARVTRKINLNEIDLKGLAQHPYIKYGEAKVILAYRKQHGGLKNSGDLLKIKIFNEEWVNRLAPYLVF